MLKNINLLGLKGAEYLHCTNDIFECMTLFDCLVGKRYSYYMLLCVSVAHH